MAFRRSFSKAEQSTITRKAILLTGAVIMLFLLVKLSIDALNKPVSMYYIVVKMEDRSKFIINQDTTNYDNFASILKEKVSAARKVYPYNKITIYLQLPKADKTAEIVDILQIVDAMDVQFKIHTPKE